MQTNEEHFDNVLGFGLFFVLLINHKLVEELSKKKQRNKMLIWNLFVLTERTTTIMHAEIIWSCDLSLLLLFFQIRHDKILL